MLALKEQLPAQGSPKVLFIEHNHVYGGTVYFLRDLISCARQHWGVVVWMPRAPFRGLFEMEGVRVLGAGHLNFEQSRLFRLVKRYPFRRGEATLRSIVQLLVYTLPMIPHFARLYRAERPAVVHVNDTVDMNRAELLAARLTGVPVAAHVTNIRRFTLLDRLALQVPRVFIASSEAIKASYVAGGAAPARILVVFDGVDMHRFRPSQDRAALRAELEVGTDHFCVVSVGRIIPWKGLDVLARAVAQLADEGTNVRWLVVGEGAGKPGLEALVHALGIADRVRFVGQVESPERYLAAADVLVQPSLRPEPLGRAVQEAMAVGCPVVASAHGGLVEIVHHGETGFLVPPGQPLAIAEAVAQLASDPGRRAEMARNARAHALAAFSLDAQVETTIRCYEQAFPELAYPPPAHPTGRVFHEHGA